MADGKAKQKRIESLHLICLAFNDGLDVPLFLRTGRVTESCVGKPVVLSPELEAKVQDEIERIRRENPELPQSIMMRH